MLRVAVIGVGRMGRIHARNLYVGKVRGARLAAVCDTDPAVLQYVAKRFPKAERFDSVDKLIAAGKVDAVIVATPHYAHPDIAVACINAGLHTLVEKPLAVTASEAKRVIAAAEARPELTVAVMFNQRTNPLYVRARELVRGGALGGVQRASYIITDWYRSQAYYDQGGWRATLDGEGGGTLINQCIHQLDLIGWILGAPEAVDVRMCTKNRDITTENDVTALFDYGDGVYLSFAASTHELRGINRLEIACTKGRIVVDGLRMKVYTYPKSEQQVNAETKSGYGFVTRRVKRYSHVVGFGVGFLRGGQQLNIVRNFAGAILRGEKLISPVSDGLAAVELINAMYLSGWSGARQSVPVPEKIYDETLALKRAEERAKAEK